MQNGTIRSGTCQRRSPPSICAVKTPSSAPWLVIPLRLFAGRWAVQKAGCLSGKIAMRPASPPGVWRVLGVRGSPRPKRLQRSKGQSSAYATAYREASREASVRKGFEIICVDTTPSHSPRVVRSLASSSGIQGGDRTRRARQSRKWLLVLKPHRETVGGRESPHTQKVVRDARSHTQGRRQSTRGPVPQCPEGRKKYTQGGLTTAAT